MPFGIFLRSQPSAAAVVAAAKATTEANPAPAKESCTKATAERCKHGRKFGVDHDPKNDLCNIACKYSEYYDCFTALCAEKAKQKDAVTQKVRAEIDKKCLHAGIFGKDFGKFPSCTLHCDPDRRVVCEERNKTFAKSAAKGKRYIVIEKVKELAASVDFKVSEQSHRNVNFCPDGKYFTTSFGYQLRSSGGPGYYGDKGQVYLRGDQNCYDQQVVRVTKSEFAQIEKAVKEYNDTFFESANPKADAAVATKPVKAAAGVHPQKEPAKKAPAPAKKAHDAEKKVEFKVGDKVVGTSSTRYMHTRKGWKGVIKSIKGDYAVIQGRDGCTQASWEGYDVELRYFKLDEDAAAPKAPAKRYVKRLGKEAFGVSVGEIVELRSVTDEGKWEIINPHKPVSDNIDTWVKKNGELMPEGWTPEVWSAKRWVKRTSGEYSGVEAGYYAEYSGVEDTYGMGVIRPSDGEKNTWKRENCELMPEWFVPPADKIKVYKKK